MGEKKKKRSRRARVKAAATQVAGFRLWDFLLFIFGIIIGRRLHIEIGKWHVDNYMPEGAAAGWDTLFECPSILAYLGQGTGNYILTQSDAISTGVAFLIMLISNIFARAGRVSRFGRILRYVSGGIFAYFILFEIYELIFGATLGSYSTGG